LGARDGARPAPVLAGQAAAGMKVVIIVGPAGSSTSDYLSQADILADQATATGMDVTKIYTPRATWDIVKQKSQGANLLVFFGHGNGYPSLHGGSMREDSQNGLGLNSCYETCSTTTNTKYYGANFVRKNIKLAKNSIVLLYRLCYASGNAEWDVDVPSRQADRNEAFQRVDNFAATFLDVGAGAVIAWGWPQKINLPRELAKTDLTIDKIFMQKAPNTDNPQAFMGKLDYYVDSKRTSGASVHLDPHESYGYLRAITGNMSLTAKEWRGEAPPPDNEPPQVSGVSAKVAGAAAGGDVSLPFFSPNGDGIDDTFVVRRNLSENATLDTVVEDAAGQVVSFSETAQSGPGTTTWNGKDANGARVPDGTYTLRMTPTDRAKNVGPEQSLQFQVLSALGGLSASTPAIEVADGDALASSVRFESKLTAPALVSWRVVDRAGRLVRTGPTDVAVDPAATSPTLLFSWDGLDDAGQPVPNGTYRGLVSATTDVGTASYATDVAVGPYMVSAVAKQLSRGQKIKISVRNTEPLRGAPKINVWQTGLKAYSVTMNKVSDTRWTIAFTLKPGGKAGIVKFTVSGTDTGGGTESTTFSRQLR
jgi:flagellar hook assembly protein FlgD